MNLLHARKQLLIAESGLNRAQLCQEWQTLAREAQCASRWAGSVGAWVPLAALLATGVQALRHGPTVQEAEKPSWLERILKGARAVSAIWLAFRGGDQKGKSDESEDL